MFGMGGSEILFILILALVFLGPDKLPTAAKTISKGIRDLKKHSRFLQQQIENDERIGGAIRDIKSALRGDEEPPRRPALKRKPVVPQAAVAAAVEAATPAAGDAPELKLPSIAGEADPELPASRHTEDAAELAAMIKPAAGAVAKTEAPAAPPATNGASDADSKHG
jgi:sec-independent protein translocase protein TatB